MVSEIVVMMEFFTYANDKILEIEQGIYSRN